MSINYEAMAKEEENKGNKSLKGGFFSNIFGSKTEKLEDAMGHFDRAANYYKLCQKWENASLLYKKCATLNEELKEFDDSADCLMKAGDMYMKVNTSEGIALQKQAADYYCKAGKVANAAKIFSQMGGTYEEDMEYQLAAKAYKQAAEYFELEKYHQSDYQKMNVKVAELLTKEPDVAPQNDIIEAIKILEKVANKYLENNLLRHSAKDLYIKALQLFLVLEDEVGYERSLESYCDKEPSFTNNFELKLVKKLFKEYTAKDSEAFSAQCRDWHDKASLDKWKTNVLSTIKRKIEKKNPPKKNDNQPDNDDDNGSYDDGAQDDYDPY